MKNSFHLRSLSIWLFFQTNESPCCENRRDFADFQKNRRKIEINRILLKKSAIQSDFIVLMERELIFQKSLINRSDKSRLITDF